MEDKPERIPFMDELLTCEEAASHLRVRKQQVWALIRSGQLKAKRIGREYRIGKEDLRRYLEET